MKATLSHRVTNTNDLLDIRVRDPVRAIATRMGAVMGDCQQASLECWLKMKKTGTAVRVKGYRKSDREGDGNPHYWVESKGWLFDNSGGVQQVVKIETYYASAGPITGRKEAVIKGGLFREDFGGKTLLEAQYMLARVEGDFTREEAVAFAQLVDLTDPEEKELLEGLAEHGVTEQMFWNVHNGMSRENK